MTRRTLKSMAVPSLILILLTGGALAWVVWKTPGIPLLKTVSVFVLALVLSLIGFALALRRAIAEPLARLEAALEAASRGEEAGQALRSAEAGILGKIPSLVQASLARGQKFDQQALNVSSLQPQCKGMADQSVKVSAEIQEEGRALGRMTDSLGRISVSQKDIQAGTEALGRLIDENVTSLLQIRSSSEGISATTAELFRTTDTAYSAVADVSSSSKEIGASMGTLSRAIEATLNSLEQISSSVRVVEETARQSTGVATEVSRMVSSEGFPAAQAARAGMVNIRQEVASSSELIDKLGARSKDIAKILAVIRDVAEQTNLLSLNASILAAQAGEHGKAFGVVADEIGSLAERTASSALEISNIVRSIQKEIADAVAGTIRGMARVEEGGQLVGRLEDALSKTLDHAKRSAEMATSIQSATTEQGGSMREVHDAVGRIQEMSRQVSMALRQQEGGLNTLMKNVGAVRDAAETTKKGMVEQNAGVRSISDNLTMTSEKSALMASAVNSQRADVEELSRTLARIQQANDQSMETVRRMVDMTGRLCDEIRRFASGSKTGEA